MLDAVVCMRGKYALLISEWSAQCDFLELILHHLAFSATKLSETYLTNRVHI